jgi:ABC-2 type transport system permease protein
MSAPARSAPDLSSRRAPAWGGFSSTVLRLEVRRLLRNRRTMLFTLLMPVVFFLIFGLNDAYANQSAGHGNVSAFVMISMALYGAILATTSGGAMVSIERAQGWSRQLRLTPLSPLAYVVTKMLTAMVLGLASVLAVYTAGVLSHKPSMPLNLWVITLLCVWAGSLVFAAFGLFMGYLLPTENVMQILSFALMLFAFGGGLFIPLSQMSHTFQTIARISPLYGLNTLVHAPLTGESVDGWAYVSVVVWLAIFVSGAVWRLRKDTARV